MEEKPQKRRRRWFKYTLRTLLILTTVFAMPLAWWSYRAERQRRAVAILESHGALVLFTCPYPEKEVLLHWRHKVIAVFLNEIATNSDMEALRCLGAPVSGKSVEDTERLNAALPEFVVPLAP